LAGAPMGEVQVGYAVPVHVKIGARDAGII